MKIAVTIRTAKSFSISATAIFLKFTISKIRLSSKQKSSVLTAAVTVHWHNFYRTAALIR